MNKWYSYSRQSDDLKLDGLKVIGYRRFGLGMKDGSKRVELQGLKCKVNLNEMILKAFANDANPKDLRFDLGDGRIAVVFEIHCLCHESKIITIDGNALTCETNR